MVLSPMFFFAQGEECTNMSGDWKPEVFFQVRPISTSGNLVSQWTATTGAVNKAVRVTYFLNYPLDCGHGAETDHLGDTERVQFTLVSDDMATWQVIGALYNQHSGEEFRWGWDIGATVAKLNSLTGEDQYFPWIAVAEDKHSSYFGFENDDSFALANGYVQTVYSNDCATGSDDCFIDTLLADFTANAHEYVLNWNAYSTRNLGEPPMNVDQPNFIENAELAGAPITDMSPNNPPITSDYKIFNQLPIWTFPISEWVWGNIPLNRRQFCGWVCPASARDAEGACDASVVVYPGHQHSFTGCATGLKDKLDVRNLTLITGSSGLTASTSCAEMGCEFTSEVCSCDSYCE